MDERVKTEIRHIINLTLESKSDKIITETVTKILRGDIKKQLCSLIKLEGGKRSQELTEFNEQIESLTKLIRGFYNKIQKPIKDSTICGHNKWRSWKYDRKTETQRRRCRICGWIQQKTVK